MLQNNILFSTRLLLRVLDASKQSQTQKRFLTEHEHVLASQRASRRSVFGVVPPGFVPPYTRPTRSAIGSPHLRKLLDGSSVQRHMESPPHDIGSCASDRRQRVDRRRQRDPIHRSECCKRDGVTREADTSKGCIKHETMQGGA